MYSTFLVCHCRFAPIIKKDSVLMVADADINMLRLLDPNPLVHLRRQVLNKLLFQSLHIIPIRLVARQTGFL